MAGLLDPVRKLANSAGTYEEFLDGLSGLAAEMDDGALAKKITDATSKAAAYGDDRG